MHAHHRTLAIAVMSAWTAAAHAQSPTPQTLLVEQGHYWQSHNNPQRAAEVWQKVLLLDPVEVDALYGLGLIGVQQGKPQQAQQYLARLQAIQPTPRQALQLAQDIGVAQPQNQQRLEEARRLVDAGERDKATAVFRSLFDGRPPQGTIGREYYNNLAFNQADWAEARSGFQRLQREMPNDSIVALFYAKHLVRREDSRAEGIRALAALTQRTDIAGDADESWHLALTWIGPPNPAQVPLFEAYLKTHPDDVEIRAQMNKGKQQPATTASKEWQPPAEVARGLKALKAGDQATAEQAFQARLKTQPDDADALGGLGVIRQQQQRLAEAEKLLGQATRQHNGSRWQVALNEVRYWSALQQARDAQAKGQTAQAQALVNQALRQNPNGADALLALADIQASAGQFDEAQRNYRQILNLRRDDPRAQEGLVNVLLKSGKNDEALQLINSLPATGQAKTGQSARLQALRATQLAALAEQRNDLPAARNALQDALRVEPDNVWTRFALARLNLAMGEPQKARDLINTMLQAHPDNADALYVSALLSVQMGEWKAAQATLGRLRPDQRTPDMEALAADVSLNLQLSQAIGLGKRGQRQEALTLLDRTQPMANNSPDRTASLASAYVEIGEPTRALALMRGQLQHTAAPSADFILQYASVLLESGEDAQVNEILRDLQNKPLNAPTRKRFDDLLHLYRIRQADHLREQGNLASAYDTLAPALAQRPGDSAAVAALARMYSANGDTTKALELYKPLLQRQPNDPQLLLGAADAAVLAHDTGFAEQVLQQLLKTESGNPQTLTEAARLYQNMGKTGMVADLLRKAVAIEQSEKRRNQSGQLAGSTVAPNPFAGVSGPRSEVSRDALLAAIPPPAQEMPGSVRSTSPFGIDALPRPQQASNPFESQLPRAALVSEDISPAQLALNKILQERSAYVTQGVSIRSNNSESGLSKLTDIETPLEINIPLDESRVALRVTPVSLNAGSASGEALQRFGSGAQSEGAGSQKAEGVGLSVAIQRPADGLKADLGTTPLGFKYSTATGGISVDRPISDSSNVRYGVSVSRRPVTDSVTSFAGTTDKRSGQSWGGVTANGGRGQLSYDDSEVGAYGYASWHQLLGNHVKSNSRSELGSGIYWYLQNATDSKLTVGLSMTGISYANNQDYFTYGHGGYFSPQTFFALGVPVTWAQRTGRLTYQVKGTVGVQHFEQDSVDYFPTDKALQAASGLRYAGQNKTGIGYSVAAAAEYKVASNFLLGANLGLDNAHDYQQFSGALSLRYLFEDISGPMSLPVSPYASPYSN
ncbi:MULTISPECIES: cellulose biosynthesis protein BcsC [Pseudomonas]|uniref:cellulose biosynthesis protein BcsC n=1 Tax=Pseudomonas TaxID=286 RepID=UPI000B355A77|nr:MULTISPECIES: cellulose biosynthesis protein BcsC [Pseudomonas]PMY55141.1 tetratricopeptide repeat protein [Pseudomonas sp. FW305-53]PMY88105.1 tetratricopeptide repeat protein [Pseudomonas sp. FW303-C2]PMY90292.1 tetratricopeptide repeat protein [Pseudomonas sp. FW305-62]PNA44885.1 tetratricopeptide repeat protein [Pseudomonas sp. FW306-2-2C-A10BC]PNA87471.1 tetratricopeptide repeat protein [Pseudomonas sp. MPR-R3B]